MGRLSDWIIGLIFFVCVYAAALWTLADVIENDVQMRTQNELNERGHDWIQVDANGRDVTLKAGTQPPAKEIAQAASHGVEEVWGVRVVHNEMDKLASGMSTDSSVTAFVATGNAGNQKIIEITLPLLPVEQESEVQVKKEPPKQSSVQPQGKKVVKPVAVPVIISEPIKKQPDKQEVTKATPVAGKTLETRKETAQKTGPLTPDECQKQIDSTVGNNVVRFRSGSSKINKQSFGLLDKVAAIAKRCRTTRLEVVGHTDNTGTHRANIRLSRLRAESVMTYLISRGVDPNRLLAQGFGSTNPVANNSNEEGRARNRRIEFNVRR